MGISEPDDARFQLTDEPETDIPEESGSRKRKGSPLVVILIIVAVLIVMVVCALCGLGFWIGMRTVDAINQVNYGLNQAINHPGQIQTQPAQPPTQPAQPTEPDQNSVGKVKVDVETFPDEVFRQYVIENIDLNEDGMLNDSEIQSVREIKVPGYGIVSLKGIEHFEYLEILNCYDNDLTMLDIGKNPRLRALDCSGNMIRQMDLLSNNALHYILTDPDVNLTRKPFFTVVEGCDPGHQDPSVSYKIVRINELNFPDQTFRNVIKNDYDLDSNEFLTEDEWEDVTEIMIRNKSIGNLEGIGYFKSLEYLDCSFNSLDPVDLSYNPDLTKILVDPEVELVGAREDLVITHPGEVYADHVKIDATNFPDETFRKYISDEFDSDSSGSLDMGEQNHVQIIEVFNSGITDLKGLEYFPTLEYLYIWGNDLTSLDVSQNTQLRALFCENNRLTSLDVSHNTLLEVLHCQENDITSLDVTQNRKMKELTVDNGVELTGGEWVMVNRSGQDPSLPEGETSGEDVTADETETDLEINEEHFPDTTFRSYISEYADSDNNGVLSYEERTEVIGIDIYDRGISSLAGIEYFPELDNLWCSKNELTELDVSRNRKLDTLVCDDNHLTSLDVSRNTVLSELSCCGNELTALDVSMNPELRELYCSRNGLKTVDVSRNPKLEVLHCSEVGLTSLDVRYNPELTTLMCSWNQLKTVDISNNPKLVSLYCGYNGVDFTTLDVSNNPKLQDFSCAWNGLKSLDVSHNPDLIYLFCERNQFTDLDLSSNTELQFLQCYDNDLTALDLSHNSKLSFISCSRNELTALDVSSCTELDRLSCNENHLTKLDLSRNTALTYVQIDNDVELVGAGDGLEIDRQ